MQPLLKWAGGKRRLVADCPPVAHGTFLSEPFLGSGAWSLHWHDNNNANCAPAGVADASPFVQRWWRALALYARDYDPCSRFIHELRGLPTSVSTENYAALRDRLNSRWSEPPDHADAALVYWINKASFNGLTRFNRRGGFNTPCGSVGRSIPKPSEVDVIAHVQLAHRMGEPHRDWKGAFRQLRGAGLQGTVFLDPPYLGGFTSYAPAAGQWSSPDLESLCYEALILHERSPRVRIYLCEHMGTAAHSIIEAHRFEVFHVWSRSGRMSCKGAERAEVTEGVWRLG